MKRILLLIIAFFTITTSLNAQLIQKIEFTISPFSFLSTNHTNLRMGFDIISSNKITLGADFGIGNDLLVRNKQYKTDYHFYQIRPMLKYNIIREDSHELYAGLEYFYFKKTSIQHGGYFLTDNNLINFENADYLKEKEGINLILGLKIYVKNIFLGDFYAGAGYYHSYTEFGNLLNGQFMNSMKDMLIFPESAGYKANISFVFGLKFGLSFGKKYEKSEDSDKFEYDIN